MRKIFCISVISCALMLAMCICALAAEPLYNGIYDNAIYTFENRTSGKNLHVTSYTPGSAVPNDANVCQYTASATDMAQKFRLEYVEDEEAFYIWAICSGGGEDMKLTVVGNSGQVADGCNVVISNTGNDTTQLWKIYELSIDTYMICPKSNTSLALFTDDTSNGTSSGTSWNSPGNAYLETVVSTGDQSIYLWNLTSTNWRYMFSNTTTASYINISSPFGEERIEENGDLSYHKGFDINDSTGGALYNVFQGVVLRSEYTDTTGNHTVIQLDDGFTVRYLHMKAGYSQKTVGSVIRKGASLGNVGNTGDSRGAHLHFDVNITGQKSGTYIACWDNAVNPIYFFPQVDFTHNYV